MADTKTSGLTADTAIAADDLLMVVDVADTTMAPTGTNKKAARSLLQSYAAGTLTTDVKVQEHTATWNNAAVTFTGWDLNVTDTASNASSLLANFRLGGNPRISLLKSGAIQTYNAYTDASNYERVAFQWDTNIFQIIAQSAGTGTGRTVQIKSGTANPASVTVGNAVTDINGANTGVTQRFTNTLSINASSVGVGWFNNVTINGSTVDSSLFRSAAGVVGVRAANSLTGGALEFIEQTAPAAPAANGVRLYAQDNGGGKTQLMALFASGAAQQVAIEP